MAVQFCLTPAGRLLAEDVLGEPDELPPARAVEVREAFARSSAEGLLCLAGPAGGSGLSADGQFWRGFARRLLQALRECGEGGLARWKDAPPPDESELAELAAAAPPMRGLELLTPAALRRLWEELRDHAAAEARRHPEGEAAFLHELDPQRELLGRVTFHLAENKRDPERPFAFLATFAHRVSARSQVAHLPLAEAVKSSATARDREQLQVLLAPVQRAAEQSRWVQELLESRRLFAPQAWTIKQAYGFLRDLPRIEAAGVAVRVPDWWRARRPPQPRVQVRVGDGAPSATGLDGLLDFRVDLALEGEPLTPEEREALLGGEAGLRLLRGKWVEVDPAKLQEALDHWGRLQQAHMGGVTFLEGMRLLAGAEVEAREEAADAVREWSSLAAGDWLRDTLRRLREPTEDGGCQPGQDLRAELRPYQADGVRWLWLLTQLGLGACLADDMGLGKTIQLIDLLLQRKRAAGAAARPSLLVAPASLLGNWRAELTRFAPGLRVFFTHAAYGDPEALARAAADPARELAGVDLVVATYGLVRRQEWLKRGEWDVVVLDEAQAIKNAATAQTRAVKQLPARARVVLTGTPVENHLGDLWSLFDFCSPGLLGSAAQFKRLVKKLRERQEPRAFAPLRRLVRPYILRRLKTDPTVAPDLPQKTEMRTECGLSRKQAALYEQAVAELARALDDKEGIERRGAVLSALMQLKQICNHPAQFLKLPQYPPADSGKFERLRLLCEPIAERQERALVFTQFQSLTEPLAAYLAEVFGRTGLTLHGGTAVKKRAELVRQFQAEGGPPFFVISLKAGGSGLNLTAASHVIHFDRWWNPAVEDQATDRAFRIGQRRNVLVHKFVCRGTLEEKIDELIAGKRRTAELVLGGEEEISLTELNDAELLRLVALDVRQALAEE